MRKRLILAAVCILALPFGFSPSPGDKTINATPYTAIALAGHAMSGGRYCDCNNPESCTSGLAVRTGDSTMQGDGATQPNATQDDLAAGFGVALLMLTLWLKLRA